jgi:putative ABC transport system permease protein
MDTLRQDLAFGVLRVVPALGRAFLPGENEPGHNKVAVLGYRLWRERFGADPAIVGQTVQLDRESYAVVDVAPAGFAFPEGAEIWRPMEYDTQFRSKSRGAWYLTVVGQIALAMMLLAGAGLLIRSFVQLRRVDPGFRAPGALTFRIALPESVYKADEPRVAFFDDLIGRLAALPGVRSAGAVMGMPMSGVRFNLSFEVAGRPKLPVAQQPSMEVRVASPGYFAAMGIPVLRGRGFERGDRAGSPPVVVLSQTAVRRFFPGEDPLGKSITVGWGRGQGKPRAGGEVVGIVGDVKEAGLAEENPPEIYLPYAQMPVSSMDVLLRTAVGPMTLAPAAATVVHGLDPELPIARLRTLDDIVATSVSEPRFYVVLLGAFAGTALFLAALGIFGMMSYAVVQRSREIGIRVALGAHPAHLRRMVLGQALLLAVAGVGLGLLGSLALSRAIAGLLFDLSPTDPATLAGVALLLTAVALLASYLPARRATRVDPLIALRRE